MSASKSASSIRRLSLLSGGSLAVVLLLAGAGAPTAALAANECGDPGANTTAADVFTCTGSQAAITYTTNGALTLQLQNNVTATTGGLVVTGANADTVTINRIADSPANSGDPSLTSTSTIFAALQVTRATAGGNISVNLSDNDTTDAPLVISGVSAGVRLANMGTATTAFTSTNGTITASAGPGIDLSTNGTGALTLTNGSAVTGSTAGALLRTTGTGTTSVTNNGSLTATAGAGLDLGTSGTGNITVTNAASGVITGTSAAVSVAGGANVTFTNSAANGANANGARLLGRLSFANTGTTSVTNNAIWRVSGASVLRDTAAATGSTTLTNGAVAQMVTNLDSAATSINFGIGGSTFANAGRLIVGDGAEGAATLTLTELAAWNNSGTVMFGAVDGFATTDGVTNDRIVVTRTGGGVFTGSGASLLAMDVDFGASQANCSAAVTADCLDLRGQGTAGTTSVTVNVVGDSLTPQRIVLVDVAGAGTDAGVFTLNPDSTGYHDADGGLVDGGLFLYRLSHDTTAKQYALTAASVDGEGFELALIGRQASEPWRTATGMWRDRQADLRSSLAGRDQAYAPGAWLKIAGGFIAEERVDTLTVGTGGVEFNTSYDQETTAVVGGVDVVGAAGENGAWVLGLTAGQIRSTADFAVAQSVVDLDGYSFGAYASMLSGPVFVDAIVSAVDLDLTHKGFGAQYESAAKSLGYQLEGGWRLFQINDDGAWVEPLASVTYVKTEVDDLVIGGLTTRFADAASLRGALGLRLGGDLVMDAVSASFSATGRVWREFDGDNDTTLSAAFGSTVLTDQGLDTLGDLGVAVSLFAPSGRLSANLAYNVLFKDGYQNTGANFGLRYRW